MAYTITRFEQTPNPNAVKCILDRPISDASKGSRSFRTAAEAGADPVAGALFAAGPAGAVTGVLMNGDWITINKAPQVDWKSVKAAVKRVLAGLD